MKCGCRSHNGFLTCRGYAEAIARAEAEGLTPADDCAILDKVGSVSGLGQGRDFAFWPTDHFTDQQYRRFLNGS